MTDKTKRVLVYHDNETLASRSHRPRPGETVGYRAIAEWDEKLNKTFDEIINLSSQTVTPKKSERAD